jgi:hypothetical protein
MQPSSPSVTCTPTFDMRRDARPIRHPPTVHIARNFESHLPFLHAGRAVICISDWQVEPATQRHFWEQVVTTVVDECGASLMARALVLVAGDMASASNELRGSKSDAAPDISWLRESVPGGDVLIVYGNHDLFAEEQLHWMNPMSGLPCLLPHGAALKVGMTRAAVAATAAAVAPTPPTPEAPFPDVMQGTVAEGVPAEAAQCVPTAEQLAGLTKQQRAALWAGSHVHERKRPSRTKSERQQKQHAAQFPEEARMAERLRALHAGHTVLRLPDGGSSRSTAQRAAASAAPKTAEEVGCSSLVVGAVHGIPASHTAGLRKVARGDYFEAVRAACAVPDLDVLVTHSNPKLAGQADVRGEDAPRLHEAFLQSNARLHVHGHMHTEPAVAVVAAGKVVVNSDCRVVVFVPPETLE